MKRFCWVVCILLICGGDAVEGKDGRAFSVAFNRFLGTSLVQKVASFPAYLKGNLSQKMLVAGASLILACGVPGCSEEYDNTSDSDVTYFDGQTRFDRYYHGESVVFMDADGFLTPARVMHSTDGNLRVILIDGFEDLIGKSAVHGRVYFNHELVGTEVYLTSLRDVSGFEVLYGTIDIVYTRRYDVWDEARQGWYFDSTPTAFGVTVHSGIDAIDGQEVFFDPSFVVYLPEKRVNKIELEE